MQRKISFIVSLIFTLTILFGAGNMNSLAVAKGVSTGAKKTSEKKIEVKPVITTDKAIEDSVKWIKKKVSGGDYKINDWYVLALSLAGENINSATYKKGGKGYIDFKKETIQNDATTGAAITLYAKNIMGIMAAGYDPSYFEGHDLFQELSIRVEKGDDTITGEAWGVIALCSGGADFNKDLAVNIIEKKQNKDGGFGWTNGAASDADTTSMVVYALSMAGKNKNTESVKKALGYLKKTLTYMEKNKSKENVETLNQILMALISSGENLNSYKINGKAIVDEIMSFRNSDGGFKHLSNGSSNEISTYQTLIGLEFYKNKKNMYTTLKNKIENALTPITATIRIEAPDKTILRKTVTLNNRIVFDNAGKAYDTKKITVYSYLMKALSLSGIKSNTDYYPAPYVSIINDVKPGTFGGWDGWMFLINGVDPGAAMTDIEVKNGDEIVVFYGDWGISPVALQVNKEAKVGQEIVISAKVADKPAAGISIIINGAKAGITGADGTFAYKAERAGSYSIYGENNDSKGKPLNIRSDIAVITIK